MIFAISGNLLVYITLMWGLLYGVRRDMFLLKAKQLDHSLAGVVY